VCERKVEAMVVVGLVVSSVPEMMINADTNLRGRATPPLVRCKGRIEGGRASCTLAQPWFAHATPPSRRGASSSRGVAGFIQATADKNCSFQAPQQDHINIRERLGLAAKQRGAGPLSARRVAGPTQPASTLTKYRGFGGGSQIARERLGRPSRP
jgi:hypothetical protein